MMEVICNTVVFQEGQLTRLMVDFEKGVWKAFKEQFPSIPIVGCNFHHLQAMRRNLQSIGLVSLYGQDLNFQYAVKLIYAMSYVPAGEVRNCFRDVVIPAFKELEKEEYFDDYSDEIDQFLSYVKRTWIGRADRQPTYALKTWNKHSEVVADKCLTNNVVESFNSSWTDSLTRRPSLYEVLGGFKRKEAVSELELREECLAVGVNSVTDNSSRNRRRSEQRADLKKLCQSFEAMSARSYMDSIIPFLSQG